MSRGRPGRGGEGVCSGQRHRMCRGLEGTRMGRWRIEKFPFGYSPSPKCAGGAGEGRLERLVAQTQHGAVSVGEFLRPEQLGAGEGVPDC